MTLRPRLLELGRRHEARLQALAGVKRVARELGDELSATLHEDDVWTHFGAVTTAVRAVHHHVELLGLDLRVVDQDLATMRAEWAALNRASAGRAWTPDEERYRDLLDLVDQLRDRLVHLLDDLRELDAAGSAAREAMELHVEWLRETGGRAARDPRALEAMRRSMRHVCTLARTSGRHVSEHQDALASRLAAMDAEAAERRRAFREVEDALK